MYEFIYSRVSFFVHPSSGSALCQVRCLCGVSLRADKSPNPCSTTCTTAHSPCMHESVSNKAFLLGAVCTWSSASHKIHRGPASMLATDCRQSMWFSFFAASIQPNRGNNPAGPLCGIRSRLGHFANSTRPQQNLWTHTQKLINQNRQFVTPYLHLMHSLVISGNHASCVTYIDEYNVASKFTAIIYLIGILRHFRNHKSNLLIMRLLIRRSSTMMITSSLINTNWIERFERTPSREIDIRYINLLIDIISNIHVYCIIQRLIF